MRRSRIVAEDNTPRIYVASLSDYNAGSLCGEWFDLDDYADADELMAAIGDMLKALDAEHGVEYGVPREEWAAHDYEGFPERLYSESMSFAKVYEWLEAVADMDEERRQAYELFVNNGDEPAEFENRYRGRYGEGYHYDDEKVMEDYAETTFWESHSEAEIPQSIKNYIDFKSMGRDILLSGDVWCEDGFVFLTR